MKKITAFVLACLTLFGFVSCNNDVEVGTPVNAQFAVSAPKDVAMKAQSGYGDTWTAMKLAYTVYRENGDILINNVTDFDASNEAHFDVLLAAGESYDFAFFAYAENSPYTYDAATCTVTADYGATNEYDGNDEQLDAFYKYANYEIKNNFTATVVLTRAVAQVNLLTSNEDYNNCKNGFYTPAASELVISSVYPKFDLKQGLAVGTPAEVTFKGEITNELLNNANCPLTDYKWLAMNYFFTNEELVDVAATIYAAGDVEKATVTAYNAPVQKNYRTNIYGDILTSSGDFTVVKSDEWLGNNGVKIEKEEPGFNTKAVFMVSDSLAVLAAHGNLQYQASTNTYRFASKQYDVIGSDNANISNSYDGWIDLFGWGTGDRPTLTSTSRYDYNTDLFHDWADYINGDWRSLTIEEWMYLENNHSRNLATVCGVHGLVLLPKNWELPEGCTFISRDGNWGMNGWDENVYDKAAWDKMEQAGALFLPAAGYRSRTSVYSVDYKAKYWTGSPSSQYAYGIYFDSTYVGAQTDDRYYGSAVRLFKDL